MTVEVAPPQGDVTSHGSLDTVSGQRTTHPQKTHTCHRGQGGSPVTTGRCNNHAGVPAFCLSKCVTHFPLAHKCQSHRELQWTIVAQFAARTQSSSSQCRPAQCPHTLRSQCGSTEHHESEHVCGSLQILHSNAGITCQRLVSSSSKNLRNLTQSAHLIFASQNHESP